MLCKEKNKVSARIQGGDVVSQYATYPVKSCVHVQTSIDLESTFNPTPVDDTSISHCGPSHCSDSHVWVASVNGISSYMCGL